MKALNETNTTIMTPRQDTQDWDNLIASIETAAAHPLDTAWSIYRYLAANLGQMESRQARTLLAIYLKLPVEKPSLIHSCILAVAVKMSEKFDDFMFHRFLAMWGYPDNLRAEDHERRRGKSGMPHASLKERTDSRLHRHLHDKPSGNSPKS